MDISLFSVLGSYFREIVDSGYLSEGKYISLFEGEVANQYGGRAIGMNSAGSCLFSVAKYYDIKKALVCNNTFYATGAMLQNAGARITLVDCDDRFSMSYDDLMRRYSDHDAVILTHIGGCIAQDYEKIYDFCRAEGILLIEDAAQAYGATFNSTQWGTVKAGYFGHAAVFSFYPTKAVPVGEGGVVVTRDKNLADFLQKFRNYGKYSLAGVTHYLPGCFNFRMDEWTAAVAYYQVNRVEEILNWRREDAEVLRKVIQPLWWDSGSNWYKYIVDEKLLIVEVSGRVYQESDQLISALSIDTSESFPGCVAATKHKCVALGSLRGPRYKGWTDRQLHDFIYGINR